MVNAACLAFDGERVILGRIGEQVVEHPGTVPYNSSGQLFVVFFPLMALLGTRRTRENALGSLWEYSIPCVANATSYILESLTYR